MTGLYMKNQKLSVVCLPWLTQETASMALVGCALSNVIFNFKPLQKSEHCVYVTAKIITINSVVFYYLFFSYAAFGDTMTTTISACLLVGQVVSGLNEGKIDKMITLVLVQCRKICADLPATINDTISVRCGRVRCYTKYHLIKCYVYRLLAYCFCIGKWLPFTVWYSGDKGDHDSKGTEFHLTYSYILQLSF